jgi:protein involved in polysaccharide export with SLBB domain
MRALFAAAIAASLFAAPSALEAQLLASAGRPDASRAELEAALQTPPDNNGVASPAVEAIRRRLAAGDFHAGDRIAIRVENTAPGAVAPTPGVKTVEQQLTGTFTVDSRGGIMLPVVGIVSLQGVLRAELTERLTGEIARVVRAPVVQAQPLVRLSVQGGVLRPGYYQLAEDVPLTDALMAAGGPARGARVNKMRIERDGQTLHEDKALQQAIAEGRTIQEMGLQPGDQIVVPDKRSAGEIIRTVGVALSIPVTIFTAISLF